MTIGANGNAPQVPQVVQPGPVPVSIAIQVQEVNGKSLVLLQLFTPTGVSMTYIEPDVIDAIIDNLRTAKSQARLGLTIVKGPPPTL